MAATIGKVRAVFTASTSGLTAGVNSAAASMKRLQSDVSGLRSSMGGLLAIQGAQLFGSVISSATNAARSLIGLGLAATESISSQNDLANRLGVTYGELAGLSYAGSLVGVSMDQIGAAMTKAQVAFANAANGSRTAQESFARLGLSVEQLNGMTAAQQFDAIAAAIAGLPTEAERAAAAVRLFGRAGAALLPMFEGASSSMSAARQRAQELGVSLASIDPNNAAAAFDGVREAAADPIALNLSATSDVLDGVREAAADPIALTLSATTDVLDGVRDAAADPIALNLSATPDVLDGVRDAAATPIDLSVTVPGDPLAQVRESAGTPLELSVSLPADPLDGVRTAAQSPIELTVTAPDVDTIWTQIRAAAADPIAVTLSVDAGNAIEQLGLTFDEIQSLSPEAQFEAIGRAIGALPTAAARAEAAVRIFGEAGRELAPIFAEAVPPMQRLQAEAERFGLTLTNAQAANVDEMGDSFDRARAAIQGVINQVTAYLAPAITAITNEFSNLIGNVGGATIGQRIGQGILEGARFFAVIADSFIAQTSGLWQYASQVGGQWNAVWDFAQRVANVFVGAFNVFEAVGNLVGGIFSNIVAGLVRAGANLAALVPGFAGWSDTMNATADQWAASVTLFEDSITQNANEAAAAFTAAFSFDEQANAAGEAMAGPLTQSIDQAIAAAQAAAAEISQAAPQDVEVRQVVEVQMQEAVRGIESRSADGIKEMFRIMRGDTGQNVQERIARSNERIADNTEAIADGFEFDVADLAPAAGA